MSGKQLTPQSRIEDYLAEQIRRREQAILNAFQYAGESCVREGRLNGDYKDQTGNLRSSIGYVLLKEGKPINESTFENNEGGKEGEQFLKRLIQKHRKGIVLIVVAGMNYSAFVEAKNYNVITSAELLAEQLVPQLLKQLGFTVK